MRQVIDRGTPEIADPDRLAAVTAIGVDETAYLCANRGQRHSRPESPICPRLDRRGCSMWW
jgi:hypothetical protein